MLRVKRSDVVLGGVAVLLGVAVYLGSLNFPHMADGWPGPGLFPRILGVLLALFGAVVVVEAFRPHESRELSYQPANIVKAGLVLVSVAIYVAVVQRLGFLPTATLLLVGLMLMLNVRLRVALPASVAVALLCVLLFEKVLRVPLPPGILGG